MIKRSNSMHNVKVNGWLMIQSAITAQRRRKLALQKKRITSLIEISNPIEQNHQLMAANTGKERQLTAEAEAIEQGQLEIEINNLISTYNSNSNSNSDKYILNFDKMVSSMPDLVSKVKEGYKSPHHGTIVQADVTLFKDYLSNVLATINHPSHTGSCAYLLDDQTTYQERVEMLLGNPSTTN